VGKGVATPLASAAGCREPFRPQLGCQRLQRPTGGYTLEQAVHDSGAHGVGLPAGLSLVPPTVAVGRPWPDQWSSVLDQVLLATGTALRKLGSLQLRSVAPDEQDQLALGRIVHRLCDEFDRHPDVISFGEHDAEVDWVASQAVDGVREHYTHRAISDSLAQPSQLGALPQLRPAMCLMVDVLVVHQVTVGFGVGPAGGLLRF